MASLLMEEAASQAAKLLNQYAGPYTIILYDPETATWCIRSRVEPADIARFLRDAAETAELYVPAETQTETDE